MEELLGGYRAHRFDPETRAFHADVQRGSMCQEAPDRAGPITNQRYGGCLSPVTHNFASTLGESYYFLFDGL